MKLAIDMQATQTNCSGQRGVGRCAQCIACAITEMQEGVTLLYNSDYLSASPVVRDFTNGIKYKAYHLPIAEDGDKSIAEEMLSIVYAAQDADAILIPNLFEGFGEKAVTVSGSGTGKLTAVILHDLIPLAMKEEYFSVGDIYVNWYTSCIEKLKQCDLILAVSEASRQDAIRLLHVPPEKVVTIMEDTDSRFKRQEVANREELFRKFCIHPDFIMYTGGLDRRKNIEGMIVAYGAMSEKLRAHHQLVIVCHLQESDKVRLMKVMREAGLKENEVIFTGFVSDEELVDLYNLAYLFVFPSRYEGFGLPILEAMRCGVPVIGADNSSIAELIARKDALFPTDDQPAFTALLEKGLTDEAFRASLIEWGDRREKDFSWEKSARLALSAIEDALVKKHSAVAPVPAPKKIAMLTPIPPQKTGIADYVGELLPELKKHFDITVYTDFGEIKKSPLYGEIPIKDWHDFTKDADLYDGYVYQLGNSSLHTYIYDLALKYPGIVVMHDFFIGGLINYMDEAGEIDFDATLIYSHGNKASLIRQRDGRMTAVNKYPISKLLLDTAKGIIFLSPDSLELVHKYYGDREYSCRLIGQRMDYTDIASEYAEYILYRLKTTQAYDKGNFIKLAGSHLSGKKISSNYLEDIARCYEQNFIDARVDNLCVRKRRIVQIVGALLYGDAVGNDVVALQNIFDRMGYESLIYTGVADERVPCLDVVYDVWENLGEDDVVVYHMAGACPSVYSWLKKQSAKKVLIYHNITPEHYFEPYNKEMVPGLRQGRVELSNMKDWFDLSIGASSYNSEELCDCFYQGEITVLPILVPFEDYAKAPDVDVLRKYKGDGWTNIVFVGRVAPHKKQEDIIRSFAFYKKHYNNMARLIIVGKYEGMENYYESLLKCVEELGVDDVIFTGHISFRAIIAYYHIADIFLCMSEHEGFCVPLLEAMYFDTPIIAYKAAAIPETLGGAGVLLDTKDPHVVAEAINEIVTDEHKRNTIIKYQRNRLEYFSYDNISQMTMKLFEEFMKRSPPRRRSQLRRKAPGILVDVTSVAEHDAGTGIQRVTNSVCSFLCRTNREVIPVHDVAGELRVARTYMMGHGIGYGGEEERVNLVAGDTLFLLDSSWEHSLMYERLMNRGDIHVIGLVHDILPIMYPEMMASSNLIQVFRKWHTMLMRHADGIICNSHTTARNLCNWYGESNISRDRPLAFYCFPMGADINEGEGSARLELADFVLRRPTFLMVGTFEVRKGHIYALCALRRLLPDYDVQLLVLGHDGWGNQESKTFLAETDNLDGHVLWLSDATDSEVAWAYQHTIALIAASRDEGYGLPLVEAAHYHLPIIASDIPIFHEVAGDYAVYFKPFDVCSLAHTLTMWLDGGCPTPQCEIKMHTWREATDKISRIMKHECEPYILVK